jgi:hypothetical protein
MIAAKTPILNVRSATTRRSTKGLARVFKVSTSFILDDSPIRGEGSAPALGHALGWKSLCLIMPHFPYKVTPQLLPFQCRV